MFEITKPPRGFNRGSSVCKLKVKFKDIYSPGGGGGTWVFFGWVCATQDAKLAPHSKKMSTKIDTLFYKWANFLYPVLEFALKLIPHSSRNGPIFYTQVYSL